MKYVSIERFCLHHYEGVASLFKEMGWRVPEYEEIKNVGFVAMNGDSVIGFIWVLVGKCQTAYIDYLIVNEEYKVNKIENRSIVGLMLANAAFSFLTEINIKKWICLTKDSEPGISLGKFYDSIGFSSEKIDKRYWGDTDVFSKRLSQLLGR